MLIPALKKKILSIWNGTNLAKKVLELICGLEQVQLSIAELTMHCPLEPNS